MLGHARNLAYALGRARDVGGLNAFGARFLHQHQHERLHHPLQAGSCPPTTSATQHHRRLSSEAAESVVPEPASALSQDPDESMIPMFKNVRAYHVARTIHFQDLAKSKLLSRLPMVLQRDSLIIDVTNITESAIFTASAMSKQRSGASAAAPSGADDAAPDASSSSPSSVDFTQTYVPIKTPPGAGRQYLVAYGYGSVVFFNVEHEGIKSTLFEEVALVSETPYKDVPLHIETHKDSYGVTINPALAAWSEIAQDHLTLQKLDMGNVIVISSVLGQSVALEYYNKKADRMLREFTRLNKAMEQTGRFNVPTEELLRLVAENNLMFSDAILNLRLLERSETAWKYPHYDRIWEGMRKEFELKDRFERVSLKVSESVCATARARD